MSRINSKQDSLSSLDDLIDVDFTATPVADDVLTFDGSNWVAAEATGGGGATALNDLTDVSATPSTDSVLKYDGSEWVAGVVYVQQDTEPSDTSALWVDTDEVGASAGGPFPYVQKSADYTILSTDYYVELTTGTFTFTLPTAVGIAGKAFEIKNSGAGTLTIDGDGSETIDGNTSINVLTNEAYTVVSDGTNYKLY